MSHTSQICVLTWKYILVGGEVHEEADDQYGELDQQSVHVVLEPMGLPQDDAQLEHQYDEILDDVVVADLLDEKVVFPDEGGEAEDEGVEGSHCFDEDEVGDELGVGGDGEGPAQLAVETLVVENADVDRNAQEHPHQAGHRPVVHLL